MTEETYAGLIEELRQQLEEQQKQMDILQKIVLAQSQQRAHDEEEGYIIVRNNTHGWVTLEHPNIEFRGKSGDTTIAPYTQMPLPSYWRDSPTIVPALRQNLISIEEADTVPELLVSMPDRPEGYDEMPPDHHRIAFDIAMQGADSDEGDVTTYPKTLQIFLMMDQVIGDTGRTDVQEMQDVVLPILELAAEYERSWRNRKWVLGLLDDRAMRIRNLTRLGA